MSSVALVTGAGRRLGREIAIAIARAGYDVAVHFHRSAAGATETVAECRAQGVRAEAFAADLSDAASAAPLIAQVTGAFGRLDALVNSAGAMHVTPLATVDPSEWDRVFAVNLRAPFFLSLAARSAMRKGGVIVNLADHLSDDATGGLVPHGISKSAVIAMTRHLARQFAPDVRVNAVSPGAVLPPDEWSADARARFVRETPLGRLGEPADACAAVVYLLGARYVTGHTLVVDGGRHLR